MVGHHGGVIQPNALAKSKIVFLTGAGASVPLGFPTTAGFLERFRDQGLFGAARQQADHDAQHAPRWRDRRAASKTVAHLTEREDDARKRWQAHAAPELLRLDSNIDSYQHRHDKLTTRAERYKVARHEALNQMADLGQAIHTASAGLHAYRDQLDGIQPGPPKRVHHHDPSFHIEIPPPAMYVSPDSPRISI